MLRRIATALTALALATISLTTALPAFAFTAPVVGALDASTPGHVAFTVTATDAPFVKAYVRGLNAFSNGGTLTTTNGPATVLPMDPDVGANFDLDTWGVDSAEVVVQACSGSTAGTCTDTPVTSPQFTASTTVPVVTWPSDVTVGPADSFPVSISDPDGGGRLFAWWYGASWVTHRTELSRTDPVDVHLEGDAVGQVKILRCNDTVSSCVDTGIGLEIEVNKFLSAYASVAWYRDHLSPAAGVLYEPLIDLHEAQDQTFSLHWAEVGSGNQEIPEHSGTISGLTVADDGRLHPHIDVSSLADGTRKIRMLLSYDDPDFGTMTAVIWDTIFIDTVPVTLYDVTPSSAKVYPFKDYYLDRATFVVHTTVEDADIELRVLNDAGETVATEVAGVVSTGRTDIDWDGRDASGHAVPAGHYETALSITDFSGNVTEAPGPVITVVRKKLVNLTFRKTVTASKSKVWSYVGRCSALAKPSSHRWAGSLGYNSNKKCEGSFDESLVETHHAVRVPVAFRHQYGEFTIRAYGGAATTHRRSVAYVSFRNFRRSSWSDLDMLKPKVGWHGARSYDANAYLSDRWLLWAALNAKGSTYDVKSFQVTLKYTALVNE